MKRGTSKEDHAGDFLHPFSALGDFNAVDARVKGFSDSILGSEGYSHGHDGARRDSLEKWFGGCLGVMESAIACSVSECSDWVWEWSTEVGMVGMDIVGKQ